MKASPREISTNQEGVHDDLISIVRKYRRSDFKKPVAEHTQTAFNKVVAWLEESSEGYNGDVIIDACCGVGESALVLGKRYPSAKIVGIDKSSARLAKHEHYEAEQAATSLSNVRVFQADLNDFWRLLASHNSEKWQVVKQTVFYPNPYPKKSQVQKRWHASPAFPSMIACSQVIEVRSNWLLYIEEFQLALEEYGVLSKIEKVNGSPITPFERKYTESGQACWRLYTLADGDDK